MTTGNEGAGEKGHGLDPTGEITNQDNAGVFKPADAGDGDKGKAGEPAPGGADGGASVFKPEGAFEHLLGQTDQETIAKYHNAYKGAREELAKGKPAIPKPEEYQWNWSDTVKQAGGIPAEDEAVKAFATIANEHGYTQQQIDAIPKFFDKMTELGIVEKPFDSAKMLEELAPSTFRGTSEERQAKGGERLQATEAWIRQLPAEAGFDDAMKSELRLLTTSAAGVKAIEAFMRSGMNASVSPGAGHRQQGVSKAALDQRVADPRNDSSNLQKHDPAFAEETRRMFKEFYSSTGS